MFWLGDKKRKLTIKYRYRKNKIIDTDFYMQDGKIFSEEFKIVGLFYYLSDEEGAKFLEWISFTQDVKPSFHLHYRLQYHIF